MIESQDNLHDLLSIQLLESTSAFKHSRRSLTPHDTGIEEELMFNQTREQVRKYFKAFPLNCPAGFISVKVKQTNKQTNNQ